MSESDRLNFINRQLQREVHIERQHISATANDLKDFVLGEPDPLVNGVPKKDNPFAKTSRGCTIL